MTWDSNPYEPPRTAPEPRDHIFRSSLLTTTFFMVLYCNVAYVVTELSMQLALRQPGTFTDWRAGLYWLGGTMLYAVVFSIILTLVFPLYVSEERLRGYSVWGWYSNVRWSEMTRVRPINMLGLKYLRIYSSGTWQVLWVPLFLARQDQFIAWIKEHTPADNPLHRQISKTTATPEL